MDPAGEPYMKTTDWSSPSYGLYIKAVAMAKLAMGYSAVTYQASGSSSASLGDRRDFFYLHLTINISKDHQQVC